MLRGTIAGLALFLAAYAFAADGDTNIHVVYKFEVYRVRPQPGLKKGAFNMDVVLHKDGSVEDHFVTPGKNPKPNQSRQKLGGKDSLVKYEVVDQNTITRTYDDGLLWQKATIRVSGKSCSATYEYKMNPTIKEREDWSVELGKKAFYREPKVTGAVCKIQ